MFFLALCDRLSWPADRNLAETGQEFAVEVALSHPGGEFQRLAVVTVQ